MSLVLAILSAIADVFRPRLRFQPRGVPVTLHDDGRGNEMVVIEAVLANERTLFHLDSGYAGPPVLSTTFLAVQAHCTSGDARTRLRTAGRKMRGVTEDDRQRAMRRLLSRGTCRSYTSGCTMRLMGIAETSEMQADLLLCPAIELSAPAQAVDADVLVTHPLPGSVHILTCDYLLHRAPAILCFAQGLLHLSDPVDRAIERTFAFQPAFFVGGAFAMSMHVGGAPMRVVIDTGASAPLSLGRAAAERMERCTLPSGGPQRTSQTGIHGETTCSDALMVDVLLGGVHVGGVQVFVNDEDVEGADGYAGMGLLRCVDLWFDPSRVGVRSNGLPPRQLSTLPGTCKKRVTACAAS